MEVYTLRNQQSSGKSEFSIGNHLFLWATFNRNVNLTQSIASFGWRYLHSLASYYWVLDTHSHIGYPLVIKHGNGKSHTNGGFNRKITDKWSMLHCHVWLPEGIFHSYPIKPPNRIPLCHHLTGHNWPATFSGSLHQRSICIVAEGNSTPHRVATWCGRGFNWTYISYSVKM